MPLGDKIRELDEQVAAAVRRAVDDLRAEMQRRLDEATVDLQRRLGEVAPELPRSFVSEEHLRQLAEEASAPSGEALAAARAEGRAEGEAQARAEARRAALGELRASLAEIDRARGQADVLQRLLDAAGRHAPRAAVLLVRDGRLAGWGARGFEAGADAARAVSISTDDAPWSTVAGGGAASRVPGARCAPLVSQLDSALPNDGCVVPLVLRDRVAAVLYADRPGEADPLDVEALQVLTYGAALALETLAVREREATSTLLPAEPGEAPAPEEVEEPAAEAEVAEPPEAPVAEAEAAPGEEELDLDAEPELAPAAGEPVEEAEPAGFRVEPEEAALPEGPELEVAGEETGFETPAEEFEGFEAAPAGEERLGTRFEAPETAATPPHGDELLGPGDDYYLEAVEETEADARPPAVTEAVDESALEETAFEEAPELEAPEAAAPPAEEPSAPIPWRTETQETTAVSPPPGEAVTEGEAVEEESAAAEETAAVEEELEERPEAGAVPPPPPRPGGAGGAVEPPTDVEGPGWAFSAAREPVGEHEAAAHEEARRLARLLVSEIQLYNQDEVDEGRRNRDIYERLRDDIDRSRQLYEERVDPDVRETTDYFYQELVRQLAAGDAKALGI